MVPVPVSKVHVRFQQGQPVSCIVAFRGLDPALLRRALDGSPDETMGSDKKDKKEKRRSEDGGVRKEKKDRKEKKHKKEKLAQALDEHLQASAAADAAAAVADADSDVEQQQQDGKRAAAGAQPRGALVYFALPLADDKAHKKVYKTVKKAAKKQALLRGVKEVNKALRKSPLKTPSTVGVVPGVVVVAGDISPDEVVMHLPVLCEEHNVPYIFVRSRAELGTAAKTKRPTSVVMLAEEGRKKGKPQQQADEKAGEDEGDDDDYPGAYKDLVKLVQKEASKQLKSIM